MAPEPFLGDVEHTPVRHHILSVLVENKAGVLSRVAGLFSRRGFNIYSLAVAPADDAERFSRLTIVVDAEQAPLEQIVAQLDKLVNVVEIQDLLSQEAVERELLLATVHLADVDRQALLSTVADAGASVIDFLHQEVTVSLAGTPLAIDAFESELIAKYKAVDIQRTGRVALPRLSSPA
jgi:acetolactate synthase I/III small subunit